MRSRLFVPAGLGLALVALMAGPATSQDPDIAAAAPGDAQVHDFDVSVWEGPVCAGATEWTMEVPPGHWIELPIGWIAADHGTAVGNWDCIDFEIRSGSRQLEVPQGLNWSVEQIRFQCDDGSTIEGMAFSPLVYLPPVADERTYQIRYLFRTDVDDGWNTYEEGSHLDVEVTLRAVEPEEEGDGRR